MNTGVYFDENTGLYWEVKSANQSVINYGENSYNYEETEEYLHALNQGNYGGYHDWRLPNMDELRSIMDYSRSDIAIDTQLYGYCQIGDYWTKNTFIPNESMAWVIYSGFGSAITKAKMTQHYVIAVRGGRDRRFGESDLSRFVDNQDGTVTDLVTGLMWQQGENQRADGTTAQRVCEEMSLAGYHDWRLPDIKEINSIQDLSYQNGNWFFDSFFPAQGVSGMLHYRASTVFKNHYSWVTNFSMGYDGYYAGWDAPLLFRAVRTIQKKNDQKGFFKDNQTGRTWALSGAKNKCTFEQANDLIKRMNRAAEGGHSNWRLPLREELRSIIIYDDSIPAVSEQWKAYIGADFLWTSQENKQDNGLAWTIYAGYGCTVIMPKTESAGVLAVCGGDEQPSYTMPSQERFVVNGDGTITDTLTDLMWMQGETPLLNLKDTLEYCKECRLGGYDDWKLPDMKELGTIINLTEGTKWFFENIFPNTNIAPQGFYMSSTVFDKSFGWGCNFQFGFDGYYADKTNGKYPFRPVRKVTDAK